MSEKKPAVSKGGSGAKKTPPRPRPAMQANEKLIGRSIIGSGAKKR